MIGWVEPEALISILWIIFHDARRFMGITCTKLDLLDPKGVRPKIRSTDGLIRNMESGIIPRRDDVSWDFRKEYLHQLRAIHGDVSSSQTSTGPSLKRQGDPHFQGDNKRLKGQIPQPIAQALQPIFNKFGCKLKLSTLLQHANTNVKDLLGPESRGTCAKALLLGCCSTTCTKRHDWNPSSVLVRRIVQKITPGIQRYVETGPQGR